MRYSIFVILLFLVSAAQAGTTAVVTVGSDGACDYATITAASFGEPASETLDIRLSKNYSQTSIELLDDRRTFIQGGFDNCSDSTPSGRTVINGGSFNGPLLVVTAGNNTVQNIDLYLHDLEMTAGNANSDGGVIAITGSWDLVLDNVYMHANISSQDGGAIHIKPATNSSVMLPVLVVFNNSIISSNDADNGGALACDGGGSVFMWDSQLANNSANQDGGAIYLNDGCTYEQYGAGFFQGILLNDASGFGGGIHAANNSSVSLYGSQFGLGQVAILSNTASNGGGISVSSGSSLLAQNAVINNNSATSTGGGIRSNGGDVIIERTAPGAQCFNEVRCSSVSNNNVSGTDPSFTGGGAIATFGGTLTIKGTYIENNSAAFGSAVRARFMPLIGVDPQITMVGNVVAKNSNAPQVIYLDESSADIAFSTFVDNEDMDRVIELSFPTTWPDGHSVTVSGSIFEQAGNTIAGAELTTSGQFPAGDCNRIETASTGDLVGGTRSTSNSPTFINQAAGDYRIADFSSMIDRCDWSYLGSESNVSANGFVRPVDSDYVDLYGSYDLGGLEHYELDLIFADDFD